jgi:hypothetical protein
MGEGKPACRQAGVGVDKRNTLFVWSPLPTIPSHQGRGDFFGFLLNVRDKFSDFIV